MRVLAGQIVAQMRFSLRVPQAAIAEVIDNSEGVQEQDFRKARNTPDRLWAEICYMKWWLTQGHNAGEDATFFTEETFGFEQLLSQFEQASWAVGRWKSGAAADLATAQLSETVKELHNRFARLAACYLIYRNGSRKELCAAAAAFGIEVSAVAPENPLRYWIVYVIVLMASVYAGVMPRPFSTTRLRAKVCTSARTLTVLVIGSCTRSPITGLRLSSSSCCGLSDGRWDLGSTERI